MVEPGHAAIRYTNPTTGGDVMATIRAEFHRLTAGTTTTPLREVGNKMIQCFEGSATVTIGDETFELNHGDVTVVPSWKLWTGTAGDNGVDMFMFSDAPIFEELNFASTYVPEGA